MLRAECRNNNVVQIARKVASNRGSWRKIQTLFPARGPQSHRIGKVPTLKDLDDAERKMNKARLALLDEIDRPQRDNQKHRQMVSGIERLH
jgi:hypothetical protein